MSIQGQFGLGTSGFNIVSAVKEGLSLCTTDGVSAVALTFFDAFGARFAVSPYLCSRIRDVCTLDQSTALGRLKVAVGYLKGDASAVLASSSAGLSAIAFIIAATEMFKKEDLAWVMTEMAADMIPSSITFPSTREINDFINIIHHRCSHFDFCTHYAEIVTAIRQSRFATGKSRTFDENLKHALLTGLTKGSSGAFDDLTRPPLPADAIPLLCRILSCMRDNNTQLHIEGNDSMGIIAAIASWWLPRSVRIVSENMVVWPCEESPARCIIQVTRGGEIQWWDEATLKSLDSLIPQSLPALSQRRAPGEFWCDSSLRHPIAGFAKGALASLGFPEGAQRERACVLIASLAYRLANSLRIQSERFGISRSFKRYIGPYPISFHYLRSSLERTCSSAPPELDRTNLSIYTELDSLVVSQVSHIVPTHCSCLSCPRIVSAGYEETDSDDCPLYTLRGFLWELIVKVLFSTLIDADYEFLLRIGSHTSELRNMLPSMSLFLYYKKPTIEASHLYKCIAVFLGVPWLEEQMIIGSSRDGVCIYLPEAFWPQVEWGSLARIRLVRGAFIYRDNYYLRLMVGEQSANPNPKIKISEPVTANRAGPGAENTGGIQSIQYRIRELVEDLKITITITDYLGLQRGVNIAKAIMKARFAQYVGGCSHRENLTLDPEFEKLDIVRRSPAACPSLSGQIGVIYVFGDHKACLYSCDTDEKVVITRGCCVNCAMSKSLLLNDYNSLRNCLFIHFE